MAVWNPSPVPNFQDPLAAGRPQRRQHPGDQAGLVVTRPCGIRIGSSRYAWVVAAGGTNRVRGTWRKAVSTWRSRIPGP